MQLAIGNKRLFRKQTLTGLIIEMLLLYYLPTYVAWLLMVFLVLFDGAHYKKDYNFYFKMSIGIIIFGALVGGLFLVAGKAEIWPYLRDIIRISFLPLTILWTRTKARALGKNIYKAIFLFCGICIVAGIMQIVMTNSYSLSLYENVRTFRQTAFISEYILAIGVFLFVFKKRVMNGVYFSPVIDNIIGIICFAGVGLSFSRTAILLLICILIFQITDIKRTIWIAIVAIIGAAMIIYFIPALWEDFVVKVFRSLTEISQSSSWNSTNIVLNWRGYETYCARMQYASLNIIEKIVGIGFGRGIDGGGYSFLVIDEPTIPWLHNGYYTTLVKQGIVGCLLVAIYWIKALFDSRLLVDRFSKRFYLGLIVGLMAAMIVAVGIFWGGVPFVYFLAINEIIVDKTEL